MKLCALWHIFTIEANYLYTVAVNKFMFSYWNGWNVTIRLNALHDLPVGIKIDSGFATCKTRVDVSGYLNLCVAPPNREGL